MKIAEGLLLRKQLEAKVKQLEPIRQVGEQGLFELKTSRKAVNEQVDEVTFQIPKVTMAEVTAEFDHYATELRKLDTALQKANWTHDLEYAEAKRSIKKESKDEVAA